MYPETRKMMEMCCRMRSSRAFFWWPGVFGSAMPRRCTNLSAICPGALVGSCFLCSNSILNE